MRWVYGSTRDPSVRQEVKWPQSTRRTIEGSIAWMRMWKGCRKQGGRLGKGARKEVCSLTVASRNVQKGGSAARKCKCQRALTRNRTLWGGGAPQVGDLRLLEDGGERAGALNSYLVVPQTVSEEQSGDGERYQECQWALTRKRTLWGGGALELGDLRLLEDGSERESALGSDNVAFETVRDRAGW